MHIIIKRKKVTKKEKTHPMWITETVTHIGLRTYNSNND